MVRLGWCFCWWCFGGVSVMVCDGGVFVRVFGFFGFWCGGAFWVCFCGGVLCFFCGGFGGGGGVVWAQRLPPVRSLQESCVSMQT